jgi:oligoribonuclease
MSDATPTLTKSDQNLIWLDCEMTGLDPETDRLIEIAVIVTGANLEPRIEGPVLVIHQSDEQLDRMDAWNKGTHGRSGLIDKVKASTVTEARPSSRSWTSWRYTARRTWRPCAATPSARTAASW